MGEQAALQNHCFYHLKLYISAPEGFVGRPWGAKFAFKMGIGEVNGARGAKNKPKTEGAEAAEGNKGADEPPKAIALIDPGPSLCRNVGFMLVKLSFSLPKKSPGSMYVLLFGGLLGGPRCSRATLRDPWGR